MWKRRNHKADRSFVGRYETQPLDAVCDALKAKGAVFTRGPETIRPGTRIAFLSGPDNVSIELLERTPA